METIFFGWLFINIKGQIWPQSENNHLPSNWFLTLILILYFTESKHMMHTYYGNVKEKLASAHTSLRSILIIRYIFLHVIITSSQKS